MRARGRLVALWVLLGVLVGTAGGVQAATLTAVKVTIRTTSTSLLAGSAWTVAGTATPAARGSLVLLQTYRSGAWRTVAQDAVDGQGRYAFSHRPPVGRPAFRVVKLADRAHRQGTSPTLTPLVERCDTGPVPASSVATAFTRPGTTSTSPIATSLGRVFCSAAPRSKIRIAMYFVVTSDDGEVETVLRPLELVHRYRAVSVRFLLDSKVYANGAHADTLARLRRFATVDFCTAACRSEEATGGVMHQKFVTMSDTTLQAGVDPVVVSSTANWSYTQLRTYWQSAQVMYANPALTREFDIRWESLRACGTAATGCAAWRPVYQGVALDPAVYGTVAERGVTVDPGLGERPGTAGRGTAVSFSPTPAVADPLASALRRYSCTPEHRTVRLAVFSVSPLRRAAADALAGLRTRGCDVSVLLNDPGATVPTPAGIQMLKDRGLPVACVSRMHDKFVVLDAVFTATGAPQQVVWSGSQNLTYAALRYDDDALVRMTVQEGTGAYAGDVSAAHRAYGATWAAQSRTARAC